MPDLDRIARQWLETDEAFGVAEVPLGKAKTPRAIPPEPARAPAPAPKPIAEEMSAYAATLRKPPAPAAAPARPAPPPARIPETTLIPNMGAPMAKSSAKSATALPPPPAGNITDKPALSRPEKLAAFEALRKEIDAACAPYLCDICTRVVFGEGDPDAGIVFIGEGPGAEEDKTGRPFVGRSGQLLDKMISAIGYKREDVFICNIVKLRAADRLDTGRLQDRPPTPEEVARGIPFLHKQLEIIHPKVIVTLGAPAIKHLTGTTEGVTKLRGTWMQYRGIPIMPTYHPSFVLRAYTEENRRKVWSDLKEAAKKARGE